MSSPGNLFLVFHLLTIVPVLLTGPYLLFGPKGDAIHRTLGRVWAILMLSSCLLTFGIRANGAISWLHLLAIFTIYQVVRAVRAVKRRDLRVHQRAMVGSYLGALGAFAVAALVPGRTISVWLFGG